MTGFAGFPSDTIAFLNDLKANNNRDWFQAGKVRYEAVYKAPAAAFCTALTFRLQAVTGDVHTAKVFRINRDIRFSKDKTPYNTHLHILFRREGGRGGLFFGLQADGLVLGGGMMGFDKGQLAVYRDAVAGQKGERLEEIVRELLAGGARMDAPALKRVPKGFDPEHKRGDFLKRKSLTIWHDLPDQKQVTAPDFADVCAGHFQAYANLSGWLDRNIPPAIA